MKKVILIILAILFVGCSEDNKTTTKVDTVEKISEVQVQNQVDQELVQEVVQEDVIEEVKSVEVTTRTGKMIFVACSGCHGIDGSKKALGKSQVIKGWSSEKVMDALNGYKAGTYGGTMKAVMQGQAGALKEDEIKSLAEYISKL